MAKSYTFYPRKKRNFFGAFNVTFLLIAINVVVFIIFLILLSLIKNPETIYNWLAIKPSNIVQGKYLWTFVTSMFMHGSLFHIFANMFSLVFIGSLIEKILGPKRYFWFYMVAGLFASLLFVFSSLFIHADFNTFAVGASGALFGLIGLLVLLTPNLTVYVMFIPIPIKMKYAGPGILVVLWLISVAGNVPIGNMAHFGGLLVGLAYGIYLKKRYKRKTAYISRHFS